MLRSWTPCLSLLGLFEQTQGSSTSTPVLKLENTVRCFEVPGHRVKHKLCNPWLYLARGILRCNRSRILRWKVRGSSPSVARPRPWSGCPCGCKYDQRWRQKRPQPSMIRSWPIRHSGMVTNPTLFPFILWGSTCNKLKQWHVLMLHLYTDFQVNSLCLLPIDF